MNSYVCAQENSVTTYIKEIEQKSSYIINYNKIATDNIYTNFSFDGDYTIANIERFFQSTPLKITWEENSILILPFDLALQKLCGSVCSMEGEPLAFANVYIDSEFGTETDVKGSFNFEYSGNANRRCIISYLGFEDLSISVDALKSCDTIYLHRSSFLLAESVIIKSYIYRGIQEGSSYGSLDIDYVNENQGIDAGNQDVLRSIQNLPGISSPDDAAANINIRGGSSDHNFISWEGAPLYDQGYLSGMISSINPFSIEKISINKSNTTAEKNCRIGGVVDMQLGDEMLRKTTLSSGFNLTEGHLNIGMPVIKDKVGILVSGRRSLFSNFEKSPTLRSFGQTILQSENEDGFESEVSEEIEPQISYQDFNAKFIAHINNRLHFRSSFLSASGNNDNFTSFGNVNLNLRDEFKTSSTATSNFLHYTISDRSNLELNYTISDYSNEVVFESTNDSIDFFMVTEETSNAILDQQLKIRYQKKNERNQYSIGYIFDSKQTKLKFEETSSIHSDFEEDTAINGQFHHLFFDQALVWKRQLLEYGLRTTYSNSLSSFYLSPSVSYRYRLLPHFILKTNAGIYHQFIRQIYETVEDDFNAETPIWSLNIDPDEPIMRAQKIAFGGSWKKDYWLIDVDAYLHRTTGLAAENPNIRNSIITDQGNKMISRGIDFLLNRSKGSWTTSMYYSLSEIEVTLPQIYDDERASFVANNNQTHKLRVHNSFQFKKFRFGLTYNFKSGLPFSDEEVVEESDDDEEAFELQYESINNESLDAYHRFDFSINHRLKWKSINFALGIDVLNLIDRENVGSRRRILTETESSNETPEVLRVEKNLLPRTLMFHARAYF